jgi:hypothetical protein
MGQMPFFASSEQNLFWYKFACAALFAMPALSILVLSPLRPTGDTTTMQFICQQSLLAAGLGLFALRMRESAQERAVEGSSMAALLRGNSRPGELPASLGELAAALERPHSRLNRKGPPAEITPKAKSSSSADLKKIENPELVRRMESESSRHRNANQDDA